MVPSDLLWRIENVWFSSWLIRQSLTCKHRSKTCCLTRTTREDTKKEREKGRKTREKENEWSVYFRFCVNRRRADFLFSSVSSLCLWLLTFLLLFLLGSFFWMRLNYWDDKLISRERSIRTFQKTFFDLTSVREENRLSRCHSMKQKQVRKSTLNRRRAEQRVLRFLPVYRRRRIKQTIKMTNPMMMLNIYKHREKCRQTIKPKALNLIFRFGLVLRLAKFEKKTNTFVCFVRSLWRRQRRTDFLSWRKFNSFVLASSQPRSKSLPRTRPSRTFGSQDHHRISRFDAMCPLLRLHFGSTCLVVGSQPSSNDLKQRRQLIRSSFVLSFFRSTFTSPKDSTCFMEKISKSLRSLFVRRLEPKLFVSSL